MRFLLPAAIRYRIMEFQVCNMQNPGHYIPGNKIAVFSMSLLFVLLDRTFMLYGATRAEHCDIGPNDLFCSNNTIPILTRHAERKEMIGNKSHSAFITDPCSCSRYRCEALNVNGHNPLKAESLNVFRFEGLSSYLLHISMVPDWEQQCCSRRLHKKFAVYRNHRNCTCFS